MKFNIILATDADYGISKYNKIPWHIPEDLKFFSKITRNNICIMGSTTAKDLGKPLRDRINIVISSNDDCKDLGKSDPNYNNNDFIIARNFEDAIKLINLDKEIFVIGGSRLYNEALKSDKLNKIYYTHINQSCGCDNFVDPILNKEGFSYEIIDKIEKEYVELVNKVDMLLKVEITFYLITKCLKNDLS
jgi:dihydrofolate reductase